MRFPLGLLWFFHVGMTERNSPVMVVRASLCISPSPEAAIAS